MQREGSCTRTARQGSVVGFDATMRRCDDDGECCRCRGEGEAVLAQASGCQWPMMVLLLMLTDRCPLLVYRKAVAGGV